MGMIGGVDIGRTSALCLLDEDTGAIAYAADIQFAGGHGEQAWHTVEVAHTAMRRIWDVAYQRGDELIACRFESEFQSRNPAVTRSLAWRRGVLTACLLRVHRNIATDAVLASEIRRLLGLPRNKAAAHTEMVRRWPETEPLAEHQRDAWAAARSLWEQELIVTAADAA